MQDGEVVKGDRMESVVVQEADDPRAVDHVEGCGAPWPMAWQQYLWQILGSLLSVERA